MASNPTQLYRGNAATGVTTLFTNTNGNTTVVSTVMVSNNGTTDATFTLTFGGIALFTDVSIPAKTTFQIADVRQILTSTQNITGRASATSVSFHISGTVIIP